MSETPITFTEPAYVIFDVELNAVRTTEWGGLAIFSTRSVAEQLASRSASRLEVLPVRITRITDG
jgi:hypothetical protein